MIATVKIAPVDRWCDWYKKPATKSALSSVSAQRIVGLEVQIDTASMQEAQCKPKSKMWNLTAESAKRICKIAGYAGGKLGLCEHMLEMD